ncbi:PKD domain-containing protein [Ferruginibacter yonginensis]|uniref:PKD domain-containing protein n=1 Tax=Ferruginibacter yonginensis TaxID=1310416 RepID=A0ABV8QQZ7_9BACT
MKKIVRITITTLILLYNTAYGQYVINGTTVMETCNCYQLTAAQNTQNGSVWNTNSIDLTQSFTYNFDVFFGCSDGADGLAFVMQKTGTNVLGIGGGAMGVGGIATSVAVTFDTYQNSSPDNDPLYDHIAIQLNGDVNHGTANTITPLTPISFTNNDVEDCAYHRVRVLWDAPSTTLKVFVDGVQRISVVRDFVNTVFGGTNLVYWGFTGATGGLNNVQKFCRTLAPKFYFAPTQKKCAGQAITFLDSSITFNGVVKRYWNFGDGSNIDSVSVNPVHTYATAGNYNVTLTVLGIDGCSDVYPLTITVGAKPIAGVSITDSCVTNSILYTDASSVSNSSINAWYWNLDDGNPATTVQNPSTTYTSFGVKTIKHVVTSAEGCISDTLTRPTNIRPVPMAQFNLTDTVCRGTTLTITDNSTVADAGAIQAWQWQVDGSNTSTQSSFNYTFNTPGNHQVSLISSSISNSSCASAPVQKTIFVVDKPKAATKVIRPCVNVSTQLLDSSYTTDGLAIVSWWWDLGNGQTSTQQNPTYTFTNTGNNLVRLVVTNSRNCISDTLDININVGATPIANFGYVPIVCNATNVQFADSSTVNNSSIATWQWVSQGNTFSTIQNPNQSFNYGNQSVTLTVTSALGCTSAPITKTFTLRKTPEIAVQFNDACKNAAVLFTATETNTNIGINNWQWRFGDGSNGIGNPVNHTYSSNGAYQISLIATSIEGCPSAPYIDTINIYGTNAFAGNDTITAAQQPVQLQATGGLSYEWSPSTGLSSTNIANPIATLQNDQTYYLKAFTPEGCESYDTIKIKIYNGPEIYVPTAFSPNKDGKNDILKAFPVGIKSFDYFIVYNRYGQIVFRTTDYFKGWDGNFLGSPQGNGSYVWIASATDFRGNKLFRKGSVLLIH